MRIISGEYRGRTIRSLDGPSGYRPATGKVREAVFSMLAAAGLDWEGAHVLDVFAGSGSLGLEALSRGAAHVTFIEKDRRAAAAISGSLKDFGVPASRWTLAVKDFALVLNKPLSSGQRPFDLVFSDPPYGRDLLMPSLRLLLDNGWSADGGLVLAEVQEKDPYPDQGHPLFDGYLEWIRNRLYGQTRICLWQTTAPKQRYTPELSIP